MSNHRGKDPVQEPWLWEPSKDPERRRKGASHFLEPPFGDPIPIPVTTGEALVVGRDQGCHIRISSPTVSRRHAEIRFRGTPPRAYLNDLGTKNGTRLSGAPVRGERTLSSGDVIRFGEVTAVYRVVHAGETPRPPAAKPEVGGDTTAGLAVQTVGALSGDARLIPLDGLLGRLTIMRASGTLEVEVDGTSGHLILEGGSIIRASFAGRDGNVAIRALAALRRGQFRYHEDEGQSPGNTPAHGSPAVVEDRVATFAREGATWSVALPGASAVRVAHVRGLAMIEVLLRRPDVEVEAFELARVESSSAPRARKGREVEPSSGMATRRRANGPVGAGSDARARRQYEDRARELEDLVSSGIAGPTIVEELATLERHLRSSATGTSSDAERARSSVTHVVRRALTLIREAESAAGVPATPVADHLQDAIRTGVRLVYRPVAGAPDAWRLTGGTISEIPRTARGRRKSQS